MMSTAVNAMHATYVLQLVVRSTHPGNSILGMGQASKCMVIELVRRGSLACLGQAQQWGQEVLTGQRQLHQQLHLDQQAVQAPAQPCTASSSQEQESGWQAGGWGRGIWQDGSTGSLLHGLLGLRRGQGSLTLQLAVMRLHLQPHLHHAI